MDKYEMVVVIVLIVMGAGLLRTWIRSRAPGSVPADDGRLARLEERVRALETIVGDSSYELKEKLRELERT